MSEREKITLAEEAANVDRLEGTTDVRRFMEVRHRILEVLNHEKELLLQRLRAIIPSGLEAFMEGRLGSGHADDERGPEWLDDLWNAKNREYPYLTGKLREDDFEEYGFRNMKDARNKLRTLQNALHGLIKLNYNWDEGGYFFLRWSLPDAAEEPTSDQSAEA